MKKTLEIRRAIKRRNYVKEEINDIKSAIERLQKIADNFDKELKTLNYELMIWDDFESKS
jgi:hypothetical protein